MLILNFSLKIAANEKTLGARMPIIDEFIVGQLD